MTCSFSGENIPTDKLFVLYYPPSMAHQNWSHSAYAAARAREAIVAAKGELTSFRRRYVIGPHFYVHMGIGLVGLALLAFWAWTLAIRLDEAGFVSLFLIPFIGLALGLYGRFRYRGYSERKRLWTESGAAEAEKELAEIERLASELPADPSAEEAAAIMRRECPEVFSQIAFQGANFRAFTYLDFVLYGQLKNPVEKGELPDHHSLHRDAYYVGEIVYDSWRTFHRDRRDIVDPRFVGSGGRRGVI